MQLLTAIIRVQFILHVFGVKNDSFGGVFGGFGGFGGRFEVVLEGLGPLGREIGSQGYGFLDPWAGSKMVVLDPQKGRFWGPKITPL